MLAVFNIVLEFYGKIFLIVKYFCNPKKLWTQILLTSQNLTTQNISIDLNNCWPLLFDPMLLLIQKQVWLKNYVFSIEYCDRKNYWQMLFFWEPIHYHERVVWRLYRLIYIYYIGWLFPLGQVWQYFFFSYFFLNALKWVYVSNLFLTVQLYSSFNADHHIFPSYNFKMWGELLWCFPVSEIYSMGCEVNHHIL